HLVLSSVALAAGDPVLAEREARAALGAGGAQVAPLLAVARAQWAQEKAADALATLDQAEKDLDLVTTSEKTFPGLFLLRGDILSATDRRREGSEAYKREIDAYPDFPWAYARLARVYAALGRRTQGLDVVRQMIATNPDDPAIYRTAVQVLRAMRDFPQADQVARIAASRFPDDPSVQALADRGRPIREEDLLP
ncbi:MAG: tetratricopeptide repeat protein, partial [Acidobacteria bacterium]|nr:tetratricopeptide repeat protein [Acidobacteriota bacterium]